MSMATYKKEFNFRGLVHDHHGEEYSIRKTGKLGPRAVAESLHRDSRAEEELERERLGQVRAFKTSKPTPSDITITSGPRSYLLIIPRSISNWPRTNHSNI